MAFKLVSLLHDDLTAKTKQDKNYKIEPKLSLHSKDPSTESIAFL